MAFVIIIIFSIFGFSFSQDVLGTAVGLQKKHDKEKNADGFLCTLYDLSNNTIIVSESNTTIWLDKDEIFLIEIPPIIYPERGLIFFAINILSQFRDFKSQWIHTWQYKDEKGSYIYPVHIQGVMFTTEENEAIYGMFYSKKTNLFYALAGSKSFGTDLVLLDPLCGKKKLLMHSTSEILWYSMTGFDESTQTIAYTGGGERVNFFDLLGLRDYSTVVFNDTTTVYVEMRQSFCRPSKEDEDDSYGLCVGFGLLCDTSTPFHCDSVTYDFQIFKNSSTKFKLVKTKYCNSPIFAYLQNEVVCLSYYYWSDDDERNAIMKNENNGYSEMDVVTFENAKVLRQLEIETDRIPYSYFGYDPQVKTNN